MTNPQTAELIIARSAIALLAATLGGLVAVVRTRVSHRMLCALVSLAAGALLAVTAVHIIPETVEMLGSLYAFTGIAVGTLLFAGIGKYVYFLCPACAASATEHDGGYMRLGMLMMVAMGIHSTVDGLAISAGSHSTAHASVGFLILFAVSYHKIPEGMALVSVARLAGYSRGKALGVTVLIELTTALGALIGVFVLRGMNELWLGLTLGLVAGSFLYTVGFALLREMYEHEKNSILLYAAIGFASIMAVGAALAPLGIHCH
ncbi:MAG: ZIP family metal transporter [Armatimonadota bacterium]